MYKSLVVAVKQRYKLKSNSQLQQQILYINYVVAVKQRYKLKSNSQHASIQYIVIWLLL